MRICEYSQISKTLVNNALMLYFESLVFIKQNHCEARVTICKPGAAEYPRLYVNIEYYLIENTGTVFSEEADIFNHLHL